MCGYCHYFTRSCSLEDFLHSAIVHYLQCDLEALILISTGQNINHMWRLALENSATVKCYPWRGGESIGNGSSPVNPETKCVITLTSQWPRWRLKTPAPRLFTQPFIQSHIKAARHRSLCGEFTGTGEFPAQRASYAENVSIWWRHHGCGTSREHCVLVFFKSHCITFQEQIITQLINFWGPRLLYVIIIPILTGIFFRNVGHIRIIMKIILNWHWSLCLSMGCNLFVKAHCWYTKSYCCRCITNVFVINIICT